MPFTITGYDYEHLTFSGGEEQVRVKDKNIFAPHGEILITAHMRSSADVMTLLLLTDALRRSGCKAISLLMPYLPYARQDRVCADGEALSLRVMCDLINAQRYEQVEIWDAHSDVALALLDRVVHVTSAQILRFARDWKKSTLLSNPILVAPDAGALKKVNAAAAALRCTYIRADKTRDAIDGSITGTVVYANHMEAADLLIVDDICDGGRTFIELAKELRKLTTGRVMLYVTHGIFSKGTTVFDGLIDEVFTANSFVDDLPPNFHLITKGQQ